MISLTVLSLFLCRQAWAQGSVSDSLVYQQAVANARSAYIKNIGINSYLYMGTAYERYWNRIAGHPFFQTDQFQPGTVHYNDALYEDVPLVYDMFRDELVSKTFSKSIDLKLIGEKISYFTIGAHRFIRIIADSSMVASMKTGFYEELFRGDAAVLVKRENKIEKSLKEDNVSIFKEYDHYYIAKDGVYHPIETEGDLLVLFRDKKTEIRRFLNRRDIRFKKDRAKTILQTVAYYAQLKK